ncbi:MAG: hypothetical protein ACE5EO_00560 [Candidatus Krumholzibacteriia bacterium]
MNEARNRRGATVLALAGIALLIVVCFLPTTGYFFAQDDFGLMYAANFSMKSSMAITFGSAPGQFRPLTKYIYFRLMYPLFGLNPLPYHIVSLVLHFLNSVLIFLLLRRLRISRVPALVVTLFFALHVGFLSVIAWISCIQQLLSALLALSTLHLALRTQGRSRLFFTTASAVTYVLALAAMEQTCAIPLFLVVFFLLQDKARPLRERLASALRRTWPLLTAMAVYLLFVFIRRGIPRSGPYEFAAGWNVLSNVLTYVDWMFDLAIEVPFAFNAYSPGITSAHFILLLVIVYNLSRGRGDTVILGVSFYLLALLPVLFLQQHKAFTHNYVPAFGMLYLVAPVVEDLYSVLRAAGPRFARLSAAAIVIMLSVISYTKVRANETSTLGSSGEMRRHVVFRRAVIARNAYDDMMRNAANIYRHGRLLMVYPGEMGWQGKNVMSALADGDAFRLFFSAPGLDVRFQEAKEGMPDHGAGSAVFFFDYLGHCYTVEEMRARRQLPGE